MIADVDVSGFIPQHVNALERHVSIHEAECSHLPSHIASRDGDAKTCRLWKIELYDGQKSPWPKWTHDRTGHRQSYVTERD